MAVDTLNNGGYRCYSFPSGLKVAGINVEFLVAYFMYGYDDEAVYSDPNRSSLYLAEYTLAPSDAEAAFAALQGKLSELYGEGVQTDAGTVWYGPGNTGVRLLIDPHEAGQLILSYGRTNSLELFSDLRAAMAREELEAVLDADGSDGL